MRTTTKVEKIAVKKEKKATDPFPLVTPQAIIIQPFASAKLAIDQIEKKTATSSDRM